MTVPTEQDVLTLLSNDGGIEPVAELLIALGYPDVAKELRSRWDELDGDDGDWG